MEQFYQGKLDGKVTMISEGGYAGIESVEISPVVSLNDSPLDLPVYSLPQSPASTVSPKPLNLHSRDPSSTSFNSGHALQSYQSYAGHLSLHDYRKYLSQADGTILSDAPRDRTLRRKPGTLNLSRARGCRDLSLSLSSSMSSAPSSPPPLSFSQSLQSVTFYCSDDDLDSPINPRGDRKHTEPTSVSVIPLPVVPREKNSGMFPLAMSLDKHDTKGCVSDPLSYSSLIFSLDHNPIHVVLCTRS
jgi:hypothetical protein